MARTARVVIPDVSLHVVQRGHDRQRCFFDESDYQTYLAYLNEFALKFACSLHAYCLMTNHVHLLLTPHMIDSCAQLMKNVGQRHVQRINSRLGRTGTLWEGRFYSCLVASERYALACYRYVELNPLRARMVAHPTEYPWSSYRANSGCNRHGLLTPHAAYAAIAVDPQQRAAAYRELCDEPLEEEMIDEIRRATRRGYVVGSPRRPRGRPWGSVMRKMGSVPI